MKAFLENFGTVLGAVTAALLLMSVVHEYGYFWPIGRHFQTFVTTSDYFVNAVVWLPAMLVLGAIGGALYALIPAICRVRFGASEILVSLMLVYVADLVLDVRARLILAVKSFNDFTKENDPYGEHDFGEIVVDSETYFWKIDYYAPDLRGGAENAALPETARVLTIMRADEY